MTTLTQHKRNWDDLGKIDPLWVVLTDPSRKDGAWRTEEFFATGEEEVAHLMRKAEALHYPQSFEVALDFGCGVGRLTRALATRFQESHGVDISESMIAKAQELNGSLTKCHFHVNATDDLQLFPDNRFNLVYTLIVLQHLPNRAMILSYVAEFCRVLRPHGLLVFQLPHRIRFRNRIQPRRRLYSLLRTMGFRHQLLYEKLGLTPIRMNAVTESDVRSLLESCSMRLLKVDTNHSPVLEDRIYYATKSA